MKPNTFNKVFLGLVFFLTLFYSFWLGIDVQRGDTKEAIADGILLAFWLFALVFFAVMYRQERKFDREFQQSKRKLDEAMGELLGKLKEDIDHDRRLHDALEQAHHEVSGERVAKPSEYKKIEARFHELTGDHYLQLTKSVNGKPDVTISDTPFKAPATKKAPVKKPVKPAARKVAEVKVPAVPAKKVTVKKEK